MKHVLMAVCFGAMMQGVFAGAIPDEYVPLPFLRGTGTQYVDSEYAPGSSTKVDMRFRLTKGGAALPFGTTGTDIDGKYYFLYFSASAWSFYFGRSSDVMNWSWTDAPEKLEDNELVANDDGAFTLFGLERRPGKAVTSFTSPDTAYIFARHDKDKAAYVAPMELYGLDIYEDGVLVRSFKPALRKSDGEAGLYETELGKFHENIGTGDFEYDNFILVDGTERCGEPEPGYGYVGGRKIGEASAYTAPRTAGARACAGWKFRRLDGTEVASGRGSSAILVLGEDDVGGTLEWQWRDRNVRQDVPEADYLLLDCLHANGKQYIDSEYLLGPGTRVDVEFEIFDASTSCLPFGSSGANNTAYYFLYDDGGKSWDFYMQNKSQFRTSFESGFHRFSFNNGGYSMINGILRKLPDMSFEPVGSAYVFARNDQGSKSLPCKMDLYAFDIYEGGELARSYVPVVRRSDGKQGLYETETKKFFENATTDDFEGVVRVSALPTAGSPAALGYWEFAHNRQLGGQYAYSAPKTVGPLVCVGWTYTRLDGSVLRGSGNSVCLTYTAEDVGALLEWQWAEGTSCALPAEYLSLEYVRSTGKQYVDTGFTPSSNTRVEMSFRMNEASGQVLPFGVAGEAKHYYFLYYTGSNWQLWMGASSPSWAAAVVPGVGYHRLVCNLSVAANGSHVNTMDDAIKLCYPGDFTATGTAFVFARNDNGSPAFPAKMDLYALDLYETNNLVRSYVPALRKADNVAGLYERLSGEFAPSEGSEPFEPTGGYVKIDGLPVPEGAVEPAYGYAFGRVEGTEYVYRAPAAFGDGEMSVACEGWVFLRTDGTTESGDGNEAKLTYADRDNGGTLTWRWREAYGFRPAHYRAEIAVAPGAMDAGVTLANFPLLVRVSPAAIEGFRYDQCRTDGANVWFSSSPAGTDVLACEVDDWNVEGESTFWVKVPALTSDTKVYVFWGGEETPARDDGAMWGDYAAVCHFSVAADGSFADSTGRGNALVASDPSKTLFADGEVARIGKSKAGTSSVKLGDYLGVVAGLNGGVRKRCTISGWFYAPSLEAREGTLQYYPFSAQSGLSSLGWTIFSDVIGQFGVYRTGEGFLRRIANLCTPDFRKEWIHLVIVSDDAANLSYAYVNGVRVPYAIYDVALDAAPGEALEFPTDHLDEVRIRPSISSYDWVRAEYAQGLDGAFLRSGPALKMAVNKKGMALLLR